MHLLHSRVKGSETGEKDQQFFKFPLNHSLMVVFLTPLIALSDQAKGGSSIMVFRLEAPSVPPLMRGEGDGFRSSPLRLPARQLESTTEGRFLGLVSDEWRLRNRH